MERVFLGIDQGSSSTKGVLLDMHGQHHQEFSVPVSTHIEDGRIEQNPSELLQSVRDIVDDAIRTAYRQKRQIAAIGLSTQRSGVCAWARGSGEVLHPLISHRDTRTRDRVERIAEIGELITQKTGLPLTAHYAGSKIALLQEEFPDPEVLIGTLDSYLVQQFTGDVRFITDDSMAARTLLYSLERAKWDPELCSFWGVNADRLPSIQPSLGQHGTYRGIPVRALLGDQQAGLFGRLAEGIKVVLNLGTITSLCVCTGSEPQRANGFVSSVLYSAGEHEREHTYLLEAITSSSGALIDLLQKKLEIASGIEQLHELCEKAKPDAAVAFLPLGGADTPAWRYDLPCLASAPINERSPEFAKAAIEHIGFSIANHIIGMRKSPGLLDGLTSIVVSGGLSDLNYLMQFIADVSEVELVRLSSREGGARGAAIAALTQTLGGKISLPRDRAVRTFTPHPHKHSQRLNTWKKLREQAWSGSFESSQLVSLPA